MHTCAHTCAHTCEPARTCARTRTHACLTLKAVQVQRYAEAYMEAAWTPLRESIKDTPAGLTEGKTVSLTKEKVCFCYVHAMRPGQCE